MKKLIPLPKLIKKAQTVFNSYIRERDKELGCISCNGPVEHAGHYFSAGSFSGLRFDAENVHGQCQVCNCFHYGNGIAYRMGLIKRIGLEAVEALESRAAVRKAEKFSRSELENIINQYSKCQK